MLAHFDCPMWWRGGSCLMSAAINPSLSPVYPLDSANLLDLLPPLLCNYLYFTFTSTYLIWPVLQPQEHPCKIYRCTSPGKLPGWVSWVVWCCVGLYPPTQYDLCNRKQHITTVNLYTQYNPYNGKQHITTPQPYTILRQETTDTRKPDH